MEILTRSWLSSELPQWRRPWLSGRRQRSGCPPTLFHPSNWSLKRYWFCSQRSWNTRPLSWWVLIFASTGLLPIPANQQEAIRRPLLFIQCRNTRQDGLQRYRDCSQRQLPPGGQSHQYLPAKDSHRQVHVFSYCGHNFSPIPTMVRWIVALVKIAVTFHQGSPGCCGSR